MTYPLPPPGFGSRFGLHGPLDPRPHLPPLPVLTWTLHVRKVIVSHLGNLLRFLRSLALLGVVPLNILPGVLRGLRDSVEIDRPLLGLMKATARGIARTVTGTPTQINRPVHTGLIGLTGDPITLVLMGVTGPVTVRDPGLPLLLEEVNLLQVMGETNLFLRIVEPLVLQKVLLSRGQQETLVVMMMAKKLQ